MFFKIYVSKNCSKILPLNQYKHKAMRFPDETCRGFFFDKILSQKCIQNGIPWSYVGTIYWWLKSDKVVFAIIHVDVYINIWIICIHVTYIYVIVLINDQL